MRAATVSEMHGVEGGTLAALASTAGAVFGGFALWAANRLMGRAAFQTAINDGFNKLTEQLQEERNQALNELQAERVAWAAERAELKGEIRGLTQAVESLHRELVRHGIPLPQQSRAGRSPELGATILDRSKP